MKIIEDMKNNKAKAAGLLLLVIFIFVFSYARTMKESIYGDFHVFWQAGRDLFAGLSIYDTREGLREFIYPPFSAFFFSALSIFPFKVATYLIFLINFSIWFFSFYLIKDIFTLKNIEHKEQFQYISYLYNYCWYGEFEIEEAVFFAE